MLNLVFQNFTTDKQFGEEFFKKILETAVEILIDLKFKIYDLSSISLSVNLVGEGRIKALNKKYRHKSKVTDVLSFPMSEKLEAKSYKLKAIDLGDIFICLPFAKKEAKRENISIDRKLAQLTVHGFLHLVGYDHEMSAKDAKKMFELERIILKKFY